MLYIKYIKKVVCIQEFYEIMIFRLPKQISLNIYLFFLIIFIAVQESD